MRLTCYPQLPECPCPRPRNRSLTFAGRAAWRRCAASLIGNRIPVYLTIVKVWRYTGCSDRIASFRKQHSSPPFHASGVYTEQRQPLSMTQRHTRSSVLAIAEGELTAPVTPAGPTNSCAGGTRFVPLGLIVLDAKVYCSVPRVP